MVGIMKYCWIVIIFLLNIAGCQANKRVGIIYQDYQYGNIREYAQTFLMLGQMMRENNFTLCLSKDQEAYFCQKIIKKSFTKEQGGRVSCHRQLSNCDFIIYILHGDGIKDILDELSKQQQAAHVIFFDIARKYSYVFLNSLMLEAKKKGKISLIWHLVKSSDDCMKIMLRKRNGRESYIAQEEIVYY